MELNFDILERYLHQRHAAPILLESVQELGGPASGEIALKQFGYGRPLLVHYCAGGEAYREVFHYIRTTPFGRERDDDRVAAVWLDYRTFNRLPRHVPAVDMLAQHAGGELQSLQTVEDVLLVTTYCPGRPYADDLVRIRDTWELRPGDLERTAVLADYLADIHAEKQIDQALWRRRLRDLLDRGEGMMGLTDSYPYGFNCVRENELCEIEKLAIEWRWRLKPLHHRLSQVHGDFHPFNIIFDENETFYVLDRSRGEWGEPADDVSCLTINYLFFSLQRVGRLERPFRDLYDLFWERYLAQRHDVELVEVIQPWFAWRALVLASPVWYPTIGHDSRCRLLTFARRVMEQEVFDPARINDYLEAT